MRIRGRREVSIALLAGALAAGLTNVFTNPF
jgi:hypothetical protein